MPWRETAPMKERMRFVTDWERDLYSMVELCERYGISRKTGYKWMDRYEREGADGLRERSRAPHHCPHRIAADVAAAICCGRRARPATSWPGGGWSRSAAAGVTTPTPASCPRRRHGRMTSGPQTSRATFGPAMASIAIR